MDYTKYQTESAQIAALTLVINALGPKQFALTPDSLDATLKVLEELSEQIQGNMEPLGHGAIVTASCSGVNAKHIHTRIFNRPNSSIFETKPNTNVWHCSETGYFRQWKHLQDPEISSPGWLPENWQ